MDRERGVQLDDYNEYRSSRLTAPLMTLQLGKGRTPPPPRSVQQCRPDPSKAAL